MNAKQLRVHIVRPALVAIDMYSESAENLVMGTAAQESHLEYVKQLGGGPALSLFQMEPATYKDVWDNYIEFRPEFKADVLEAVSAHVRPPASRLVWDVRLAAIMCRIHYRRVSEALPNAADIWGLASYWKRFYNTASGAGTQQEFVDNYRLVQ